VIPERIIFVSRGITVLRNKIFLSVTFRKHAHYSSQNRGHAQATPLGFSLSTTFTSADVSILEHKLPSVLKTNSIRQPPHPPHSHVTQLFETG